MVCALWKNGYAWYIDFHRQHHLTYIYIYIHFREVWNYLVSIIYMKYEYLKMLLAYIYIYVFKSWFHLTYIYIRVGGIVFFDKRLAYIYIYTFESFKYLEMRLVYIYIHQVDIEIWKIWDFQSNLVYIYIYDLRDMTSEVD